jgi:hypothetical protein
MVLMVSLVHRIYNESLLVEVPTETGSVAEMLRVVRSQYDYNWLIEDSWERQNDDF